MYERFFSLNAKPFAMNPDPAFLYPSSQHATALTMLEYAVEAQSPFCMLTGEIGSGKTTLLRHFLRMLGDDWTVGLISNTHERFRSIHPWAVSALGITCNGDSEVAVYEALVNFLVQEYSRGRRALLVVDEAHNLTPYILEELRLLSNVNSERDVALQVILVGQPELRVKLQQPELRQFAQRLSVDFHLSEMSLEDATAYIAHRLGVAGGSPDLFEPGAVAFIHACAHGVPRLMNQLCDLALVYAFAEQRSRIDSNLLERVITDREHRGAMPLFEAPAAMDGASIGTGTG